MGENQLASAALFALQSVCFYLNYIFIWDGLRAVLESLKVFFS